MNIETSKDQIQNDLSKALELHRAEKLDEALKIYSRIEKIANNDANIKYLIGVVYYQDGKFEKAVSYINKAIEINPNDCVYYYNLGNALTASGKFDEAAWAYEEAISAKRGNYPEATYNLGAVLDKLNKWQKELEYYYLGLNNDPGNETLLYEKLKTMQKSCYWNNIDQYEDHLLKITKNDIDEKNLPQLTPYQALTLDIGPVLKKQIAQNYANLKYSGMKPIGPLDRSVKRKINIGYLYIDQKNSKIISDLYTHHNHDEFTIYAYSYSSNDPNKFNDNNIKPNCDHYYDLSGKRPEQIAKHIYNNKIDILIDLTGYSDNALPSILAMRPAPIQISYLTYPATMGAKFIDYLIADNVCIPKEHKKHYTEKILYLSNCYYFTNKESSVKNKPNRSKYNLPEDKFVFCCFNKSNKIDSKTYNAWMDILSGAENSVLWLQTDNEFVQNNLKEQAEKRSINSSRILFTDKEDQLEKYKCADLFLDCFIVNARSKATQALSTNLPVLTKAGDDMISRSCASILTALSLDELITNSVDQYTKTAIKYATGSTELKALNEKLENNIKSKALFNQKNYVQNFEELLVNTYKKNKR